MQNYDNQKRTSTEALVELKSAVDEAALKDDRLYFEQYEEALTEAVKKGALLPKLTEFSDIYERYVGGSDTGSASDRMYTLYNRAERKYLEAYYRASIERTGEPPTIKLSLAPEMPIAGERMPLLRSEEYSQRLEAYKNYFR